MKKINRILLIVFAVAMMIAVQSAHAVPTLTLQSGTTTVTILDNGAGDVTPVEGAMTFSGAVGDFFVNVSTGVTKPVLGSTVMPWMDLNSINVSSTSGTLEIWFRDSGFTYDGGLIMNVGGTFQDTATFETLINGTTLNSLILGPGAASGTLGLGAVSLDSTDILTLYTTITHTAAGSTSFDQEVVTPEPGTLLLLGSGLVGAAFYARRRRIK